MIHSTNTPADAVRVASVPVLDEFLARQGVTGPQDPERLAAPDLWKDDQEFDRFLEWLTDSRREGR